jgi:hypothetical protein
MIKMMTTREKELQMVKKRDIFCFEVLRENKENYNMTPPPISTLHVSSGTKSVPVVIII